MRERLIELIQDSVFGCARHWAEIIADNLLANGVIVPPCKVGDMVYCIYEDNIGEQYFADKFVTGIFLNDLGLYVRCGFHYYAVDDFGKTVFLTREEAEKALKGGE